MNPYTLRKSLNLIDANTAITREDFESLFCKTAERVTFTFNGWDGKSYDGESRSGYVYRTIIEGYENVRFVKVGKGLHTSMRTAALPRRLRASPTRKQSGWSM